MRRTWQTILFSLALAGSSAYAQSTKPGSLTSNGTIERRPGAAISRSEIFQRATGARSSSSPRSSADNRQQHTRLPERNTAGICAHKRNDPPTVVVNVVTYYTPVYDATADIYAYEEAQSFYRPGYDWGVGLRANNLPWAELLPYLREYVVSASPVARDAFREGFIVGFGGNGEETYDRVMRRASRGS